MHYPALLWSGENLKIKTLLKGGWWNFLPHAILGALWLFHSFLFFLFDGQAKAVSEMEKKKKSSQGKEPWTNNLQEETYSWELTHFIQSITAI